MRKPRLLLSVAALMVALSPRVARADDFRLSGMHLSYDIGASVGQLSGFRQALGAGVMFGWMDETGSNTGMWGRARGWLLGASGVTGFHAYPSYVMGELGYGADTTLAGVAGVVGPAMRVDPTPGAGLAARLAVDLLFLQTGIHVTVIAAPQAEAQFMWTIGLGRY